MMKIITQHTKKLISVFIILILASCLMLVKGCGGSSSDSCSEGTAPFGSTITPPADQSYTIVTASGALTVGPLCVTGLDFILLAQNGQPLDNLWVQVRSDGLIAGTLNPPSDCGDNTFTTSALTTQSSNGGTVSLDFQSGVISKPTATATSSTVDYVVNAKSCTAVNSTKISFAITWTE